MRYSGVPRPCSRQTARSLSFSCAFSGQWVGIWERSASLTPRAVLRACISHRLFLLGLGKFGKGDWRSISRNFVISRTPTQARARTCRCAALV